MHIHVGRVLKQDGHMCVSVGGQDKRARQCSLGTNCPPNKSVIAHCARTLCAL